MRTPSAGTPEGSVHSCMSPASFRSCCSVRGRSRSNSVQRELTVPIGPLLRTEMRSWSRSRCGNSPTRTAEKVLEPSQSKPVPLVPNIVVVSAEETEERLRQHEEVKDDISPAAESVCEAGADRRLDGVSEAKSSGGSIYSMGAIQEIQKKRAQQDSMNPHKDDPPPDADQASKAAATSSLLDYLPETPLRTPQEFGKTPVRRLADDFQTPVGDTPESRAESRKKHVLAKVAQEHESVRKQHFVFGQKGSTPLRTPLRKKLCKAAFDSADPEFCKAQNSGEAQKTAEGKDSEESVKA